MRRTSRATASLPSGGEVVQRLADPDDVRPARSRRRERSTKSCSIRVTGQVRRRELGPGQVERRARDVDAGIAADIGAGQRGDAGRRVAAGHVEKTESGRRLGEEHAAQAA